MFKGTSSLIHYSMFLVNLVLAWFVFVLICSSGFCFADIFNGESPKHLEISFDPEKKFPFAHIHCPNDGHVTLDGFSLLSGAELKEGGTFVLREAGKKEKINFSFTFHLPQDKYLWKEVIGKGAAAEVKVCQRIDDERNLAAKVFRKRNSFVKGTFLLSMPNIFVLFDSPQRKDFWRGIGQY